MQNAASRWRPGRLQYRQVAKRALVCVRTHPPSFPSVDHLTWHWSVPSLAPLYGICAGLLSTGNHLAAKQANGTGAARAGGPGAATQGYAGRWPYTSKQTHSCHNCQLCKPERWFCVWYGSSTDPQSKIPTKTTRHMRSHETLLCVERCDT